MLLRWLSFALLVTLSAAAQAQQVVAGPMPGHSAMRAVQVWIQTDAEAEVRLAYRPVGSAGDDRVSEAVVTDAAMAHAAEIDVTGLEPGTVYEYRVLLDGTAQAADQPLRFRTQPLWQWREDPPDFSFALGSCSYVNDPPYDRPGRPYGGEYQIYDAIAETDPDFMIWLGDNVYYREVDWDSPWAMVQRFSHARQLPEMQRLLRSTHHFATWDDHDYGPNNADRSYALRDTAKAVFDAFWPNPPFSGAGGGGVMNYFEWHDAGFFLLDNRFFRSANDRVTGERTILGRDQVEWLIDALKKSNATFKFVVIGGQFINSAELFENYIALAPGERREILDRLAAEDIPGVVFLTGDRHHSVLLKMDRRGDYPLHDWTVSPLTAGPSSPRDGEGQYRVEGSLYTDRNFGRVEISGPRDDRVATLVLHDSDGEERYRYTIRANDLRSGS
ncbi:alkaline phosphatase family protein [Wenzhouxiangella sp. XN79A]|uniref:alkaline phosphatase D family protein n=1 Tax=Wenzhouxiangella sp. XN79A TaxID=2724193 RepID=UPI00144AF9A5|nr:alkaline phosphatase D family protein [Wenzhouxiangella sp. XN79A]NKI33811.1 alkaline phosphatase family protein [Wenzhouxiangella sp. XN79A]